MGGEGDHACVHEGGSNSGCTSQSLALSAQWGRPGTQAQSIKLTWPETESLPVVTQLKGPPAVGQCPRHFRTALLSPVWPQDSSLRNSATPQEGMNDGVQAWGWDPSAGASDGWLGGSSVSLESHTFLLLWTPEPLLHEKPSPPTPQTSPRSSPNQIRSRKELGFKSWLCHFKAVQQSDIISLVLVSSPIKYKHYYLLH